MWHTAPLATAGIQSYSDFRLVLTTLQGLIATYERLAVDDPVVHLGSPTQCRDWVNTYQAAGALTQFCTREVNRVYEQLHQAQKTVLNHELMLVNSMNDKLLPSFRVCQRLLNPTAVFPPE